MYVLYVGNVLKNLSAKFGMSSSNISPYRLLKLTKIYNTICITNFCLLHIFTYCYIYCLTSCKIPNWFPIAQTIVIHLFWLPIFDQNAII